MEQARARYFRAAAMRIVAGGIFGGALVFTASSSMPAISEPDMEKGLAIYREAFLVFRSADKLVEKGRAEEALRMYEAIYEKLVRFKNDNPLWNNAVTKQKIDYCRRKIERISKGLGMVEYGGRYMKRSEVRDIIKQARSLEKEEMRDRRVAGPDDRNKRDASPEDTGIEGGGSYLSRLSGNRSHSMKGGRARSPIVPGDLNALQKAKELRAQGRDGEALMILEDALEYNPENAVAYLERAELFLSKKQYDYAANDYRAAIYHGETGGKVHYGLGTAYEKQAEKLESTGTKKDAMDKYRDAVAEYKEALWQDHDYALAYYSLGCVYSRMGMREDAIYYFKKTLRTASRGSEVINRARYNIRLLGGY